MRSMRMIVFGVLGGAGGFVMSRLIIGYYVLHSHRISNTGAGLLITIGPPLAAVIAFDLCALFVLLRLGALPALLRRLLCRPRARKPPTIKPRKASAPPPGVGWF
jgi:hypothetical protein